MARTSDKGEKILEFVQEFVRENGYAPSVREIGAAVGLNSTAFSVTAKSDGILITTWGHGHRVGMSQYGADAMAIAGNSYEQILLYYYQGTRIDKMDSLG